MVKLIGKILCRIGMHNWCTYKVGHSVRAGFCSETPISNVCRRCGETHHVSIIMLGHEPQPSKDAAMVNEYLGLRQARAKADLSR